MNPYRKGKPRLVTRRGQPVDELRGAFKDPVTGRVRRSSNPISDSTGEINAGSKTELISAINGLLEVAREEGVHQARSYGDLAEERAELLSEALNDKTGESFRLLGEEASDLIYDHVRREGFIRKVIAEQELVAGTHARIRVRKNWARAAVMGTAGFKPFLQAPREQYYFPPEYYVTCHVLVEDKEISQAAGDLLTERLEDGQERVQVQEDTVLKRLLDLAVTSSGNQILFSNFSPALFQTLRNLIQTRGIPCSTAMLAGDLWNDIVGQSSFSDWFDPVTQHELVLTGVLGSILNVTIITDAFVQHDLRVLQPGEVYFLGIPRTLGKLFIRQPLKSEPVDQYSIGRPVRGWFMSSIQACAVANVNAVARGRKL